MWAANILCEQNNFFRALRLINVQRRELEECIVPLLKDRKSLYILSSNQEHGITLKVWFFLLKNSSSLGPKKFVRGYPFMSCLLLCYQPKKLWIPYAFLCAVVVCSSWSAEDWCLCDIHSQILWEKSFWSHHNLALIFSVLKSLSFTHISFHCIVCMYFVLFFVGMKVSVL